MCVRTAALEARVFRQDVGGLLEVGSDWEAWSWGALKVSSFYF